MISTYYINTYYIDAYCIIALRFIVQYAVKVFNENEKLPACGDFSIIQLSNYRDPERIGIYGNVKKGERWD